MIRISFRAIATVVIVLAVVAFIAIINAHNHAIDVATERASWSRYID